MAVVFMPNFPLLSLVSKKENHWLILENLLAPKNCIKIFLELLAIMMKLLIVNII